MVRAFLAAAAMLVSAPLAGATLSEGEQAYQQNRIAEAERAFRALVADPAAPAADKGGAARGLARIAWLIDGEADAALRHLAIAEKAGDKPCDTGLMFVRVLREASRSGDALRRGEAFVRDCDDPIRRDQIRLQLIRTHLELAAAGPRNGTEGPADAAAELSRLSGDVATSLDGARARLEIGLLTGNAETTVKGWKDYFWLTDDDAPQALSRFDAEATL